jgi:LysM repeat protein
MKILRKTHLLCLALLLPLYGAAQQTHYFLHTVTKGQSLYSIATMYNVSTSDIISLNPGSDKVIKAGSTLKIPQKGSNVEQQFHTIQSGETLYRLTQKYGVTAQSICDANPGLSASNFRAGQVIVIPHKTAGNAVAPTVEQPQEPQTLPVTKRNDYQDIHRVKKNETTASIAADYGITRQDLIDANPELKTGAPEKGKFLRIPYPKSKRTQTTATSVQAAPSNQELFNESSRKKSTLAQVNVAVILPFMSDGESNNEQKRMVEYYEGFLLAVDSLKQSGYSYNVYAYDTKGNDATLKGILAQPEMKKMNLIVGPVHTAHIKEVADFAKSNQIRMVVPFSSKNNEVFNNPYVYQINTPQSYLYSEVYDHFMRCFRVQTNIIFVDTKDGNTEKTEFIRGLKMELDNQHVNYNEVVLQGDESNSLKAVVSTTQNNLFIPTSGANTALIKLMPYLKELALENPDCNLQLFGYPEWQTYTNDYINEFYTFDTYFYGSFYTNNLATTANQFQRTYRKWYGKTMMNTYPKYAILGFDTGYYFLKGLSSFGNSLENNLDRVAFSPIQTSFKFDRVNTWGGFINKKVFFVHFTKNHEIIKMDFDR